MRNRVCRKGNQIARLYHSEFQIPHSAFRCRGQTLIIVLWVMGLVSLAVGSLSLQSDHALRLARFPVESLQRRALAQAAVQQALVLMVRDDATVDHLGEPWATGQDGEQSAMDQVAVGDGLFRVGATDADGTFTAGLIDEERKLDLRYASPQALQALVRHVGVEGSLTPEQIAEAIVDWRDEAIGAWCDEQQLGYACHNGLLDSVDELRLVPGITNELFSALEPYVTVYGQGAVNINTASAVVLDALGCSGEALVEARAGATPPVLVPSACPGTVGVSSAFTVPVEAWLSDASSRTHLRAVIRRDGMILAWSPQ